jgi:Cu/Zn superoxide dismutase
MKIKMLEHGLHYCGRAEGVRQTYHVFEAPNDYFVMSFARSKAKAGSGYFNVVSKKAVEFVRKRHGRAGRLTAKDVAAKGRRTRHFPTNLVALNVLYVLVALKQASIVHEGEHRQLFFSLRKK